MTTPAETKRLELTRLGFACGLFFLLITVLASFFAHRDGNRYVTFGTLWASGRAAVEGLDPYVAYPATYRGRIGGQGPANYPDLNLNPPWTMPLIRGPFMFISRLCAGMDRIDRALLSWGLRHFNKGSNRSCRGGRSSGCRCARRHYSPWFRAKCMDGRFCLAFWRGLSPAGPLAGDGNRDWMCRGHKTADELLATVFVFEGLSQNRDCCSGNDCSAFCGASLIYGVAIYKEWLRAFAGDMHWLDPVNIAIMPFFRRYGHPSWGIAIAILIAVGVGWWIVKKRPDFTAVSGAALCVGMLSGPLAWMHYVLFAAPFFMARRWTKLINSSGHACYL